MSKRRLLWVNHFANTLDMGGGTRHVELANELAAAGWTVDIAASDFNLQARSYMRRLCERDHSTIREDLGGVTFHWFWAAAYQKNDWRRLWNWVTFAGSIRRWNPNSLPDVVIGSSPHLFASLAAHTFAKRHNLPFVMEVRDLWPESLLAVGGRRGIAYVVFRIIANFLYKRSERIIVLARGTTDHLVERGIEAGKIVYIPNGVDVGHFSVPARRTGEHFTLVYIGAHGPANGLDVVLEAAALLQHIPAIRFLFVGDGPSKPTLQEQASSARLPNVEFRGVTPKSSVPNLLAEVDAGLMVLKDAPLFSYGVSPNKLFDYMGASLPIVCNVPGEVARMVQDARAGVQAQSSSASALAAAIEHLYKTPLGERNEMGARGREWVTLNHGRDVLANRLSVALTTLLQGGEARTNA